MQAVSDFGTVIATIDFKLPRLALSSDRDQDLSGREGSAVLGEDFELLVLDLLDLADFDAFLELQLFVSNRFFNNLNEVVTVKIAVNVQLADVLDRLRLGVDFFTFGESSHGAGQFGPFKHDVLEAAFFAFDGSRNPRRTTSNDHQV